MPHRTPIRRPLSSGLRAAALLLACTGGIATACEAPPPAVRDIDANGYYSDSHHSIVDPALKARNEAAVKPVTDYLNAVAHAADAWSRSQDPAQARCALDWLASWAGQEALLGRMTTEQSYYTRKWTLAGLALSYARVQPAAAQEQRRRIERWLLALADATMRHADAHKGIRNNHYYWEGLAVAATGAVTGDARSLAWGRRVFDDAMGQVQPDGTLPYELERGGRALAYHLFAAAPLVMLASILDVQAAPLDRLVALSVAAAADPSIMEKLAGVRQERQDGVPGWIAIWQRHGGCLAAPLVPPARNFDARMGGDRNRANPLEHVHALP